MKKLVLWVSIFILIGITVAYLVGFRVVYNPQLTNDWDAIEATGTWIGVVSTLVLTGIIIHQTQNNHTESQRIQKELSEKETKSTDVERRIELFEHRHKIYNLISSVHSQFYTHHYAKESSWPYNALYNDNNYFKPDRVEALMLKLIPSNEYLQIAITAIGKTDDLKLYQLVFALLAETKKVDFFFTGSIRDEINEWAEKWSEILTRLLNITFVFHNSTEGQSSTAFLLGNIEKEEFEEFLRIHQNIETAGTLERIKSIIEIPQS